MRTGSREELQKKHLRIITEGGGFQFADPGTFKWYTSGQIGSYYVQSAAALKSCYSEACDDMEGLIRDTVGVGGLLNAVISGGETRDWMFSFSVADRLKLPPVMLYKNGNVLGADMNGKRVIHVADLNNEGSSMRDLWGPSIIRNGGMLEHVFFYVDRMEDGTQVIEDLELNSHALVPLDKHAWDYLKDIGAVESDVYEEIRRRMENKDAWAREMFESDSGFKTLLSLPQAKREKTIKAYPYLNDMLVERLTD